MMQPWYELEDLVSSDIQVGGICEIYAIPLYQVESIPEVNPQSGVIDDDISLQSGSSWISVKGIDHDRQFVEKTQETGPGISFQSNLQIFIPGHSLGLGYTIQQLLFQDMILLIKERNGITKLWGDHHHGIRLAYQYTSGDASSVRGYTLHFSVQSRCPAKIYEGTI